MTTVEQKLEILIGKLQLQLVTTVQSNEELQAKVHELQTELDTLKLAEDIPVEDIPVEDLPVGNLD